ncbi:hypothetical protein PR048_008941 [Dryococelus australis]|uniref:Uncharacterized protein n=1 Tax=Dryococelus australis TaxID=614101 RepID=A0ABQ9HYI6_9NEOP|nr:hypothetical protein PR048_008941 [Dryococelus australis]
MGFLLHSVRWTQLSTYEDICECADIVVEETMTSMVSQQKLLINTKYKDRFMKPLSVKQS